MTDDPDVRFALESNYAGLKGKKLAFTVVRRTRRYMDTVLEEIAGVAAHADYDLVIHHTLVPGQHIGEYLGVAAVPVALQPVWVPTSAFPSPFGPQSLPAFLNRATYLSSQLLSRATVGGIGSWRSRQLGLARKRRGMHNQFLQPDGTPATVLQAFSSSVLPKDPDYPDSVVTTGFWYLPDPEGWAPDAALQKFLDAGEPPVYVGFGSMTGRDPDQTAETVAAALRLAKVRAVVVTGEGGISANPFTENVFVSDDVPHSWLFPRMSAVVHHGGGGTTAAAMKAGVPQVVCPFTGDQPFWARKMHRIGVATQPVPQAATTPENLAQIITQAATSHGMKERAADVAADLALERGTARAVEVVEKLAPI
ncbi:glycosyltransferase [Hoyosella altamirensis]|uniref:Sterol 3beta-glucosyltransferase n=1 Tax=Hoyosella altamirensis TaxID=616997 RepID=A0A839RLH5_9ACTN|nr:glycosyltransferase [Hoyosella altamirensis]MBB3037048.1 sterol 3beta-glucosyltransferase [Hoyosella altamirensis]